MISDELKVIVDKFNEQGKMNFLEATTEEKITEFEKEHNVKLPEKYKEWLLFSDGGEFFLPAGIQLYGVEHKPVVNVDNNDRPSEDYIVIGALASGDPILCEKAGEKIAIYNQEAERIEDDEIYDDFIAFLNDLYDLLGIGD
ncbi:SMI1/KNR4 family protein [Eubacterium sp. CAG:161]|uniref:SMI1/KNR4 family protein n=1 Tax=Eubacterium sp. CAG:161 TaxID=1262881 RepID=UPI00033EAA43|nr:SMI1/KNR4 family protein [Eubacterium sp. CAG:161]CCY70169.1 sMI1 / KNR4 family protein [Eubacterium sp. CAG:161]